MTFYPTLDVFPEVLPSAPPLEPVPFFPEPVVSLYPSTPAVKVKVLTQAMHDDTLKLLRQADIKSSTILHGDDSSSSHHSAFHQPTPVAASSPVFLDFSDRSFRMFSSEKEVHHHYHGSDSKGQKDDTGLRILVGVVGVIVAGVAAFCIGKAMAEGEDAEEENLDFEILKGRWGFNKDYYDYDYQMLVEEVVVKADELFQREQTHRTHKLALLVFALLAGGIGFAGALIGSGPLMAVAAAISACVIVAGLFKAGYACFSTRDKKDAQAIDQALDELCHKTVLIRG